MAGYSETPLWKKLGYKDGITVYVEDAPEEYLGNLQLPTGFFVYWVKRASKGIACVHFFVSSKSLMRAKLRRFRNSIDVGGVIWVSWPKKSSGVTTDINENTVREIALPLGLVDVKVCAVNEIWSGLKLMIRRSCGDDAEPGKRSGA